MIDQLPMAVVVVNALNKGIDHLPSTPMLLTIVGSRLRIVQRHQLPPINIS
jgi:hypothetical protein